MDYGSIPTTTNPNDDDDETDTNGVQDLGLLGGRPTTIQSSKATTIGISRRKLSKLTSIRHHHRKKRQ